MKNGILIKQGKGWKLKMENGKTVTVAGNFGLPEEAHDQAVQYELQKGQVSKMVWDNHSYQKASTNQPVMSHNKKHKKQISHQHQSPRSDGEKTKRGSFDPARAPYNFIPLNPTIVPSDGSKLDHAFFQGLDGYIDVEIKALSPLFIRRDKEDQGESGQFFSVHGCPTIPGSSLRGLLYNLVQILSYSQMDAKEDRHVEDKKLYKRSSREDAGQVLTGFLRFDKERGSYKIYSAKNRQRTDMDLDKAHLYQFGGEDSCIFSVGEFNGKFRVWEFQLDSGNSKPIDPAVLEAYLHDEDRSPSAVNLLRSIQQGVIFNDEEEDEKKLVPTTIPINLGIPVFCRLENGKVASFGHAKYFRMEYPVSIGKHIQQKLLGEGDKDICTTIFGTTQQAGKIQVEDFPVQGEWDEELEKPKHPRILSSPKPTSYQHYLVQPKGIRTNQMKQKKWGDENGDTKVPIRGFKQYWHRETSSDPRDHHTWQETNLTGKSHAEPINPLSPGSTFKGRIRFQNLTEVELGALLMALELPEDCAHKLGLGKPLGLGSVRMTPRLFLINRKTRYQSFLNDQQQWEDGVEEEKDLTSCQNTFAAYVDARTEKHGLTTAREMWTKNDRISALKEMLKLNHRSGGRVQWNERTRYMELEEFKRRPVLPEPKDVPDSEVDLYRKN